MKRVLLFTLLLGVCLIFGCGPNPVRHVQSELLIDGSVDRAILQPKGSVFDATQWDMLASPDGKNSYDQYDGDITLPTIPGDVPTDGNSAKAALVRARKRVKAGEPIPSHVEIRREGVDEASTLKLERVVNDYGFVTECLWSETLTEVLDFADSARARRELVTFFADQCERTFRRRFQPEYDSTELVKWIRTDGGNLFEELFQTVLQRAGSSNEKDRLTNFERAFLRLLTEQSRKFEIEIVDFKPSTKVVVNAEPEVEKAIQQLAVRVVARKLKRRDGKPVDEAVVREWLFSEDQQLKEKWSDAWEQAASEYPGGKNAFEQAATKLMARICGIHGGLFGIFGSSELFRCTVTMPGVIVESNGTQVSERRVQWRFRAVEAFPHGYPMTARSIVIWDEKLPGMRVDWHKDRRNWLKLIELARRVEKLPEVLRQCRASRSLFPLEKLQAPATDSDLRQAANAALLILSTGAK